MKWPVTAIDDGDDEKFTDSDEVLRKESWKLGRFQAPRDACFRTSAQRVEAHLQNHRTVAGAAPFGGFFTDSGGQYTRMV
jgi:hypothetical protein